jgi:Lon protease-like protein
MDLPEIIPIFPLPNVVLFPGVPLPLHIFEPRYREMIADIKDGDGIIGMTLLRGDWRSEYYETPEVFHVGCAGKIVSVEELPDGRFNILLHGIREFEITSESRTRSYRLAEVRWRSLPPPDFSLDTPLRESLMRQLHSYVAQHFEQSVRRLLDDPTLGDQLLVNFFCYALDLEPLEKQGLLEALSLGTRAERLAEVLDFQLHLSKAGLIEPSSGKSH